MMNIIVNGEPLELAISIDTVGKLIAHLELTKRRFFIVEKNREVVKKEDYATTIIGSGDQFEIVHFVGGG
ncbi:sulfur carrier protein ThiS [Ignatzschineria sp. LJL83]